VSRTIDEALALRAASLWNLGQADAARDAMQQFMRLKRGKMTEYPGDDVIKWQSYLLRLLPIPLGPRGFSEHSGMPACRCEVHTITRADSR
jgi:hypothetical protein